MNDDDTVGTEAAQRLGLRIRDRRKELGLTQESMAEMLDIRREYLSRIEAGTHPQYFDRLVDTLDAIGLALVAVPKSVLQSDVRQAAPEGDSGTGHA